MNPTLQFSPLSSCAGKLLSRIGLTAETVRRLTAPVPRVAPRQPPHTERKSQRIYGACEALIIELARMKRRMTVEDVMREIPDRSRDQLLATLSSMCRRGKLVCLQKGTPGRTGQPSIYTTRDHAQPVNPGTTPR